MCIIDCLSTIVFILPLHLDYTKVIILILWWRNFQLEYWRTFQLVSTLISELSGKITVFSYNEGKLERLQTIVCDPFVAEGNADIHVSSDGKFLYASKHLKEDGIIVYSIDSQKGTLVQIGFQPTGLYPRSFAISPDGCYLAVVCRDANCIQIFERNRNTGLLKNTGKNIRLERPAFVKFL